MFQLQMFLLANTASRRMSSTAKDALSRVNDSTPLQSSAAIADLLYKKKSSCLFLTLITSVHLMWKQTAP